MLEYRDKIRKEFSVGIKVMATLYDLRHEGIYEPQIVTVAGATTEEDVKRGYRFGLYVEYDSQLYWVLPDDVKIIEEDF